MGGRTSAASHNKYNAKAYDRINLVVRKGQKEQIQEYIAKCTHRAKPAEKNATYRKPRRAGV